MSHVLPVGDADFDKRILHAGRPVVVDFYAHWCGPCGQTMKALEALIEADHDHPEWKGRIFKVDTDASEALMTQYKIEGVPTFICFENGKETAREEGAMSRNDLKGMLTRWLP